MKRGISRIFILIFLSMAISVSAQTSAHQPRPTLVSPRAVVDKPLPPEKNPPGDIPDNQVFVHYASTTGGYELKVPEGWARTTLKNKVLFTRYFDGLSVSLSKVSQRPSAESIARIQANQLKKSGGAVTVVIITDVTLKGQPAVLMRYRSNSSPSPVTGKRVRLENETFFFYRAGRLAAVRLWAPLGADNVDQWRLISRSFTWR